MHVASLRPRRDPSTWTLTIEGDGTQRLLIDVETIDRLRLHQGVEIDQTLFAQLLPIDTRLRTRIAALTLLHYRLRGRSELVNRLRRRRFPADAIAVVMDELAAQGLVDDERFARMWATAGAAAGRGPHRIATELRLKGIPTALADEVARQACTPEVEMTAALDLVERRVPRLAGLPEAVQQRRIAGLLRRRGFSGDIIAHILRDRWPRRRGQDEGTDPVTIPRPDALTIPR